MIKYIWIILILVLLSSCTKPIPEVTYLTKYDTIYVSKLDTTYINKIDTTFINTTDTLYIVLTDTIYIRITGNDSVIIVTPSDPEIEEDSIADVCGNRYSVITIGTQSWMGENLRTNKYNTGEDIPTTILNTRDMIEPRYQFVHDSTVDINRDGRFYTWYTATDPRGVCPDGYHVPSRTDWQTLGIYLADNGYGNSINKNNIGKSVASASYWRESYIPTTIGYEQEKNNTSGFNALPVGNISDQSWGLCTNGNYSTRAVFWTSTDANDNLSLTAYNTYIKHEESWMALDATRKSWAYSIRCVKN